MLHIIKIYLRIVVVLVLLYLNGCASLVLIALKMSRLVTLGNPFKHYKRATAKTVFPCVRVGVIVKT